MNLSTCPEAFLTLRAQFVKTHATLSICQYILGIGDRHLSNFLVDLDTGASVGIDFGYAFGTATQVSPQTSENYEMRLLYLYEVSLCGNVFKRFGKGRSCQPKAAEIAEEWGF